MDNYIWVFQKKDDRNLLWAFACSLGFHFVLLAILIVKPFYPIAGISEKLDSIWLYPALTVQSDSMAKVNEPPRIVGPAHTEREKAPAKDPAVQPQEEKRTIVSAKNEIQQDNDSAREEPKADLDARAEPVTELVTSKAIVKKVEKAVEKENAAKKPVDTKPAEKLMADNSLVSVNQRKMPPDAAIAEKDIEKKIESAKTENLAKVDVGGKLVAKADEGKALPGPIQNATSSARRQMTQSARKDKNTGGQQTVHRNSTAMKASRQTGERRESNNASDKKVAGNPLLPTFVAMESPFLTNTGNPGKSSGPAQVKPGAEPSRSQGTGKPLGKESPGKAPSVAGQPKSKNEENGKNPADRPKNGIPAADKQIALLPLTGDLKLEITGNTGSIVSVSFKEYLKSHRNRPMTRAEAKRVQYIKPMTRTVGKVFEAVVGTTGEGIYEFIVVPGNANPVTAVYKVKIYEDRSKAKTKLLGTRTIKEKTVVARILMPEGIFWEDENNFSGYLEDSDSITKYNSENGLVWKEYKSTED